MPKSTRIPSPARSQGGLLTPRRHRSSRTRSVGSPARSNASGRLTSLLRDKAMDSFALSPMPDRRSILTDDTDIEQPRRKSWWKKLNENSRDVIELLDNKEAETDVIEEYINIEVLSKEKNNYTNDLPESSDSESINSIVMPQRKLFTQKESQPQKKFGQLIGNRESMAKLHKTNSAPDKTINAGTKNLFPSNKQRSRPVFPSALLNISPNKTVAEKTKDLPVEPPKNRNIFGNRPATKRKNMFTEFIMSDSEDEEIPEIQPKIFGFQKQSDPKQCTSVAPAKLREPSPPTFNFTTDEMDEWKLLPSSTMIDKQLENTITATPVKKSRLSKLSEAKESEIGTNINMTEDRTKQSNKSASSKNKSKLSNNDNSIPINTSVRNKSKTKLNISQNKTLSEINEKDQYGTASLVDNNEIGSKNKSQTRNMTSIINTSKQINQTNNYTNKNVVETLDNDKNQDEDENDFTLQYEHDEHDPVVATTTTLKNISNICGATKTDKNQEEMEIDEDYEDEIELDVSNELQDESHEDSLKHSETQICLKQNNLQQNASENHDESKQLQNDNEVVHQNKIYIVQQAKIASAENEEHIEHRDNNVESDECEENEMSQEIENDSDENQEIENDTKEHQEIEHDTEDNQEVENNSAENNEIDSDVEENQETENDTAENHEIDSDMEENEETENDAADNHEIDSDVEGHQDIDNNATENQEIDSDNEEIDHDTEENQEIENDSEEREETQVRSESHDKGEESEEVHSENEESQSENEVNNDLDDNQYESEEEIQNDSHSGEDVIERTETPDSNQAVHSPEAILHDKTNHIHSFTAHDRNATARKTKSLHQSLFFRPSMAPPRESTSMTDGTGNSSAGSGWDSHRVTRKTIRLTFGKEMTPRKSLRALVMEKSAKRQTANDLHSGTVNLPQTNSTEMSNYCDAEDQMDITDPEVVKRTRQATLDEYMRKIRERNMKIRLKAEEAVKNSLNTQPKDTINPFKVPTRLPNAARRPPKVQRRPQNGHINSLVPMDDLPPELLEDMKYKPPKRFKPGNAAWITKRLYKYLETKLEPRYDYKARVRSEQLVETIYNFAKNLRKLKVAPRNAVDGLKHEMARLDVVTTHFEFYQFFHEFMPREIRIKVVPDVANDLPLPTHGVYSDIIRGNAMQE